jgi:hypothetical protein
VKKIVAVALLLAGVACAQEAPLTAPPVRKANVRIVVRDTTAAVDAIAREAEGRGGYVAETRLWRDGDVQRATITLRVPARQLTSTLASIHRIAQRVEDETIRCLPG